MDDEQQQSLDSLTEQLSAAHLQLSPLRSGKHGAPDTRESCRTDEPQALSNLAGELQDLIITNLHPSAAIALSRTNRHFHSCVNLHRLSSSVVFDYLHEMELLPTRSDEYACYTCLRLKPQSAFTMRQTTHSQGKLGQEPRKRFCLDCGIKSGRHLPGHMMKIGTELQVYCGGCETLQKRFCGRCCWCESCIRKGPVKVLRKGQWAKPNGEASEVILRDVCRDHTWGGPEFGPSRCSLSIMLSWAIYEFESQSDTGMIS